MMMFPPMQQQEEPPAPDAIPDQILDKYERVYKGFRETVAHMLRSVDGESWPEESDCIHLLMHLDSKMEMAIDWIAERRPAKSLGGEAGPTGEAPGNGGSYL